MTAMKETRQIRHRDWKRETSPEYFIYNGSLLYDILFVPHLCKPLMESFLQCEKETHGTECTEREILIYNIFFIAMRAMYVVDA